MEPVVHVFLWSRREYVTVLLASQKSARHGHLHACVNGTVLLSC